MYALREQNYVILFRSTPRETLSAVKNQYTDLLRSNVQR